MELTLLVHAFAAGLGLVLGSVALYASKGATLHRKSGILFVYALVMFGVVGLSAGAGDLRVLRSGASPRRASPCPASVAHVLRVVHRGVVVFHRPGGRVSEAGVGDDGVLALARPEGTDLSGHGQRQRTSGRVNDSVNSETNGSWRVKNLL
jgi:hypothetical protein